MLSLVLVFGCIERTQTPTSAPSAPQEPAPKSAPHSDPAPDAITSLSGRQIWLVNAPAETCTAAESLGLEVTCDTERPGAMREEIVCWCPDISQAALLALQEALMVPDFALRSWSAQPAEADPEECGSFAEITVRY